MNYMLLRHLNIISWKKGRTKHYEKWLGLCSKKKNVPIKFWAEALNTTFYTLKRVYLHLGTTMTPYEIWKGKKPNLKYFHEFRSTCFILNDKEQMSKFDVKSDEGIFLGYSLNSRAYRV